MTIGNITLTFPSLGVCRFYITNRPWDYVDLDRQRGALMLRWLKTSQKERENMTTNELFCENEPIYQPAKNCGYRYRELASRQTITGWYKTNGESVDRAQVAAAIGVSTAELLRWERATDLEAEEESRSNDGDY